MRPQSASSSGGSDGQRSKPKRRRNPGAIPRAARACSIASVPEPAHRIDERQIRARAAQRQHGGAERLFQRRLDHRDAVAAPVQRFARQVEEQAAAPAR